MLSHQPIGVFDSGIGGLTVLKTLRERFPKENFIYVGDTARIPYGTKSLATIERYLTQNLNYLESLGVKAIVIACNSASSAISEAFQMTEELKSKDGKSSRFVFKKFGAAKASESQIMVYDTISPGARCAASLTQSGTIGVIGTKATVARRAYIEELLKINPKLQIFQQACPLLVPLVEEGWDEDPITNLVVYRYLSPLMSAKIDTLIMGCTHYPVLAAAIKKVTGPNVELVDSSESIADEMAKDFANLNLVANTTEYATDGESELRLYTTDLSPNYESLAARIMNPLPSKHFELVDIS